MSSHRRDDSRLHGAPDWVPCLHGALIDALELLVTIANQQGDTMPAIDNLRADDAALLGEVATTIDAAVAKLKDAAANSGVPDSAIDALDTDVKAALANVQAKASAIGIQALAPPVDPNQDPATDPAPVAQPINQPQG